MACVSRSWMYLRRLVGKEASQCAHQARHSMICGDEAHTEAAALGRLGSNRTDAADGGLLETAGVFAEHLHKVADRGRTGEGDDVDRSRLNLFENAAIWVARQLRAVEW